ncbi:hypothetical protein ACLB2K_065964 [Fragaria x ananassa]
MSSGMLFSHTPIPGIKACRRIGGSRAEQDATHANTVKDLRSRMDGDVTLALKKAKVIKVRLEALDRSNRSLPGCGPGSSSDRTRISVVNGLRKKLKDSMESFNSLRQKISLESERNVSAEGDPGARPGTGAGHDQRDPGAARRGERHGEESARAAPGVPRHGGVGPSPRGQLDDIESHVQRASSFVRGGRCTGGTPASGLAI